MDFSVRSQLVTPKILTPTSNSSGAKARAAAREAGNIKAYDSYQALIDSPDIDVVYLPLPNHLHLEWAIKCLDAGKHVLCEKPMGMCAAEVEKMLEARDRSGLSRRPRAG